jgi:hypothetical protein
LKISTFLKIVLISVELAKVGGVIATRFEHFDQSNSLANQKQGAINSCVFIRVFQGLSKLSTLFRVIAVCPVDSCLETRTKKTLGFLVFNMGNLKVGLMDPDLVIVANACICLHSYKMWV